MASKFTSNFYSGQPGWKHTFLKVFAMLDYLFVCSLWLLGCIIFWGHGCAANALPPVTNFTNFGKMADWVNLPSVNSMADRAWTQYPKIWSQPPEPLSQHQACHAVWHHGIHWEALMMPSCHEWCSCFPYHIITHHPVVFHYIPIEAINKQLFNSMLLVQLNSREYFVVALSESNNCCTMSAEKTKGD